jgi:type II secretory pathway pseudopilin PulG
MVVIAVISILLGLLLPGLNGVRRTTYRVLSASNQRTLGQGLTMWAGAHRGRLPQSRVQMSPHPDLGELMRTYSPLSEDELAAGYGPTPQAGGSAQLGESRRQARTRSDWLEAQRHGWDGLGRLFASGLVPESRTFYCPAHWGEHTYERYEHDWVKPRDDEESQPDHAVYGNYHYRGHLLPNGRYVIMERDPDRILVTDGLRRQSDLNHRIGLNVLRADNSVEWMDDPTLRNRLPLTTQSGQDVMDLNEVIAAVFTDPWKGLAWWQDGGP